MHQEIKPRTKILVFKDTERISTKVAQILQELKTYPKHQPIHIALSGGNTPKAIFKILHEKYVTELAGNRFHFWWGDERCVSPDHDESNFKWAYTYWLKPIGIPEANIHRIHGENDPDEEIIRYSEEMKKWIKTENAMPRFDVIFLGLGDDGHTASIFPSQMQLLDRKEWCAVATHPASGQKRITLTGNVLNNARQVVFISTGTNKAAIIKKIVIDEAPEFPASHIKPVDGETVWLIDEEAASKLPSLS
ncbi:MAG TPA: 6-phosphogluconolactonase [Prolixibacteraceae bacterium]|nr:6-phosphogluconolactonase [Prolixibacteraceae bacterium]HPS12271.1 6-phosphogluconolactonase [Prolixibacteraceae bacterium]